MHSIRNRANLQFRTSHTSHIYGTLSPHDHDMNGPKISVNLKWEPFPNIILQRFWAMLNEHELTDCTIACSPLETVRVHRVVLSANSPYFRALLAGHTHNPILILHDVSINVLNMLVNFMYRGTVTCDEDEMPSLLRAAESLQIVGLSQTTQTRESPPPPPPQQVERKTDYQVYSKKARILDLQNNTLGPEQVSPLALRKKESISAPSTPQSQPADYYKSEYASPEKSDYNSEDELLDEEEKANAEEMTPPRYNCVYCASTYPSQSTLSRHIMLLHPTAYTKLYNAPLSPPPPHAERSGDHPAEPGPPQSPIVCKFCGKPFPEVSQLIQHLPIHTGERPFKCEFCGKAFKLRHHMKDHARVHTGERPFRCSICGKTFSRSTILKAHEKTHFPKGSGEVSPGGGFKLG